MNMKMLMLVVLSAAMLTGLAATSIQATPVFASKDECEKNSDNNCNEVKDRSQYMAQGDNNCRVEHGSGDANGGDSSNGGSGGAGTSGATTTTITCNYNILDPNTGDNSFNPPP